MNQTDFRRRIAQSAELVTEAASKQVQGMSDILQTVLAENKDLHNLICREQAERASIELDNLSKNIEIQRLDATICELITPRRWRQ